MSIFILRANADIHLQEQINVNTMFECKSDGHCENNCPYFMDCDWIREQVEIDLTDDPED